MLAAVAAVSCEEKVSPESVPSNVIIEPVITRASEVNFEQGDKIGVTITNNDGVYADNAMLTYDGMAFSGDLKWYSDGGQTCTLKAFYPYAQGGFPTSFTVGADQTAGAGQYDLMMAAKTNVKPQEAPVTMVFQHQLSQITVDIDNQANISIQNVTLKGLLPKVDFTFGENGSVVATADASAAKIDIAAEAVNPGIKYRAIVVPQTMSFGISIKSTGGSVVQNFSEVTMKPGYTYSIKATVTAEGVIFKLSGEIEAWEDGGVITPGDDPVIPDEPEEFEEGEGYFVYAGKRYNTVKLPDNKIWMAEPLAYVPKDVTVSDDPTKGGSVWYPYSSDGTNVTVLKDEASIKSLGLLYSYDALLNTTITADNFSSFEGAQGICPKGWHIPTRAEWYALCGSSNASALLGEKGTQTNTNAYLWDPSCSYSTVAKFNDAGFAFTLSGNISNNKYNALIIDSSVCSVEAYYGKNRMAYIATSTANSVTQYFAVMTTFTSANNLGKVSLSFAALGKVGVQVRCVKD